MNNFQRENQVKRIAVVIAFLFWSFSALTTEVVCTRDEGSAFVSPVAINERIKEYKDKGRNISVSAPALAFDSNGNQMLCVTINDKTASSG